MKRTPSLKPQAIRKRQVLSLLFMLLVIIVLSSVVLAAYVYYDPSSTIQNGWSGGTAQDHTQIVDTAREPTTPDTTTNVASKSNSNEISEFGFPAVTQQGIANITLWVYTATEANAQYTFELRQGATTICQQTVTESTASSWQSCTWQDPTGDLSDLRLYLGIPSRPGGGGKPGTATVYAAYIDAFDVQPPNVTLQNPPNNTASGSTPIDFEFSVSDELFTTMDSCSLYTNFTGTWSSADTITNVATDTLTTFSQSPGDGLYEWNVRCNTTYESSYADTNRTLTVYTQPPTVTLTSPQNQTVEQTSNTTTFEYSVSDDYPISECQLDINGTTRDSTVDPARDTTNTFTAELENGIYEWNITCSNTLGTNGTSETRTLDMDVHEPVITTVDLPQSNVLNAGSTKRIECNVTVEDGNGAGDINTVNATFHTLDAIRGEDNTSNHYTNESCQKTTETTTSADYTCSFEVWYEAHNGTWTCNVTATDAQGLEGNFYNQTTIDPLYAINVSSQVIDYGDVPAGSLSNDIDLDLVNIGNQEVGVSVRGYGGDDPQQGDGYAMICDSNTNISVSQSRYALTQETIFDDKTPLSSIDQDTGLQLSRSQTKPLFWQLQAPPTPVTSCYGRVIFTASII